MIIARGLRRVESVGYHQATKVGFTQSECTKFLGCLLLVFLGAAATLLDDLRVPPGNRLEALHGDLKGSYSIRINYQYRIVFKFKNGDAYDVKIVDYH